MAADKKGAKATEDGAAADSGAADEKKKKIKKILMIAGLGILLVGISVGATVGVLKLMAPKKVSSETAAEASDEHADSESGDKAHEPSEPILPIIYYALKPNFTVNYDVNGRQRFLQAELTISYRNPAALKVLELHMPAVRNGLVLLLSSQVFDDLQTVEGKEKLRSDALKIVQEILIKEQMEAADKATDKEKEKTAEKTSKGKDKLPNVEQVLFTNFVMQ